MMRTSHSGGVTAATQASESRGTKPLPPAVEALYCASRPTDTKSSRWDIVTTSGRGV